MKTIYKYEISPHKLRLEMPKGARILAAREQFENICIWAEVDTEQPQETRYFEVFGTGHAMHEDMGVSREYLGTAVLGGGALILHVYEYSGI